MTEYITVNSNNLITAFVWSGLLDRAKCGELLEIIKMCSVEAVPIEVLQEIKQDIDEWYQFPHSSLNWHCYTKLCEIFNKHINNDQFERIWQNTVEEMRQRKICEDILEEAEEYDSETMSGSLLTDDDLRQLIGDGISRCKEQDKVTQWIKDNADFIKEVARKLEENDRRILCNRESNKTNDS